MNQASPIRRFPKKSFWTLAALTALVIAALFFMTFFAEQLNERFNLNPGIPNVAIVLAAVLGVLIWPTWMMFWARKWVLGLVMLVLPVAGLVLYHPNFGGDAEILGWEPRFWSRAQRQIKSQPDLEARDTQVDLTIRSESDFSQFLGPDRNGIVTGLKLSRAWKTSPPKILWKQPIGEGWSGFAAVNGFAITQEQQGENECVTCYEVETGKLIWIRSQRRRHEDLIGLGKVGPRATPTIAEGRVFVMGGTGVLDCLSGADGELLWSVDIPLRVGVTRTETTNSRGLTYSLEDSSLDWGRAASPLIFENLVIVAAGGPKQDRGQTATLIAFDKQSGAEVWRGGNLPIAYGSPTLAVIAGQPQVLLVAESYAVGHDARTGVELWRHERYGLSNGAANCSQVTVLGGNRLLLSKGYNEGGEIIELQLQSATSEAPLGSGPTKASSWRVVSLKSDSRLLKTKLTNPVIRDNHAYCLSDGYLECTQLFGKDPNDPKQMLLRKWKTRGDLQRGQRIGNGQLLLIGDLLLVHSEAGELLLVEANPESYQQLGSIETISGICWNTMCVYQNRVLVRSEQEAAGFELPIDSSSLETANTLPNSTNQSLK